jgi:hypothetical protein
MQSDEVAEKQSLGRARTPLRASPGGQRSGRPTMEGWAMVCQLKIFNLQFSTAAQVEYGGLR